MIVYRVLSKENINYSNPKRTGTNSFTYNDTEYMHFFILPENAETLQILKYKINNQESSIIKCDIPYNLLEFGIGLYTWYYHFKFVPFLEVRIKKHDFKPEYIKETSTYIKHEWKNSNIFKRYLINCIYNQKAYTFKDNIIKVNNNFNFLHYFNKIDLEKENILVNDYPQDISFNDLKKQELSISKRILISFKEEIEMFKDLDVNFYNLDYNEKKYQKR